MQKFIHPSYSPTEVVCVCGNTFNTQSTIAPKVNVQSCSLCHPAYTGKAKVTFNEGKIAQFNNRYPHLEK